MKNEPQFACATKRTLQWVIYNMKGYLNTGWHLLDLSSYMCCVLEMSLMRNFAADLSFVLPLEIFKASC